MMRRFLIDPDSLEKGTARLTGDQARHALRVLRLKRGDTVSLIDGCGHEYEARITGLLRHELDLEIIREQAPLPESRLKLVLGLGLIKADRMDVVVQKGTELGVRALVPVISSRTGHRPSREQSDKRRLRWQKIAREALKQCRRSRPMEIRPMAGLSDFIEAAGEADFKLILYEEKDPHLNQSFRALTKLSPQPQNVWVLVGPEGGFTQDEVLLAGEAGFKIIHLGPRILRSETAALALISILGFEWGDLADFD